VAVCKLNQKEMTQVKEAVQKTVAEAVQKTVAALAGQA
jgi:hypothetical protein